MSLHEEPFRYLSSTAIVPVSTAITTLGIGTTNPTGNLSITQTATATGALKGIVYTGAVNTNQTLSTEIPAVTLTTAGRQWATGALTTQREILITQPTYSFVGASTITTAVTMEIVGAPIAGTSATITNAYGLRVNAGQATAVPLVVKGAAAQSANLQEWHNSAGTLVAQFAASGHISINRAPIAADTVLNVSTGNNERVDTTGNARGINMTIINALSGNILGQNSEIETRYVGTVSQATCYIGVIRSNSGGGSIIDSARNYLASTPVLLSGGLINTAAGIWIEAQKIAGVTNGYGVYALGASDKNYFAGTVGIGVTATTARLHLAAGTTAASTSPVKFTSGSLLTAPEAGAVEFLTDAFYGTITTGAARKTFAFLESPTFTGAVTLPTPFTLGAVSVTATGTEVNYLVGVTSAIQTQLNAKQPLDATLTALAAYGASGLMALSGVDVFTGRTITGVVSRITVSNGNGFAGDPTIDISGTYVGQASITTLGTITTGTWSAGRITDAGLTAGRVTFAGTGGLLSDDADLTFATDTLSATKVLSSSLTASCAVVSDGSKVLVSSATTATEIGYVSGVTSAIQTQLDAITAGAYTDADARAAMLPEISVSSERLIDNSGVNSVLWTTRELRDGSNITSLYWSGRQGHDAIGNAAFNWGDRDLYDSSGNSAYNWSTGTFTPDQTFSGALTINSPSALIIPTGTDQRAGNLTLVGGTLTVNNTTVTANTLVLLTCKTISGIGAPVLVSYTLNPGTSFTVNSDPSDASTYSYFLIENP